MRLLEIQNAMISLCTLNKRLSSDVIEDLNIYFVHSTGIFGLPNTSKALLHLLKWIQNEGDVFPPTKLEN